MSAALLRMGASAEACEFVRWYAGFQSAQGDVPCAVDLNGPDLLPEHDSHGELIFLVAEVYRFTRDKELLEKMKENPRLSQLPVIVYTGKELTKKQETELRRLAETIIIKDVKSPDRLLDEPSPPALNVPKRRRSRVPTPGTEGRTRDSSRWWRKWRPEWARSTCAAHRQPGPARARAPATVRLGSSSRRRDHPRSSARLLRDREGCPYRRGGPPGRSP